MKFDEAFAQLIQFEGDYSNNPADPGGETRWGITRTIAEADGYSGDMRDFPLNAAKLLYKEHYWTPIRADELPEAVRYAMFDAAVNSGDYQAVLWLQRACGVKDDGAIGPVTLAAANAAQPDALKAKLIGLRLQLMTTLPSWPVFGKGWARRLATILTF